MRISDWSSDVCSSDLPEQHEQHGNGVDISDLAVHIELENTQHRFDHNSWQSIHATGEARELVGELIQHERHPQRHYQARQIIAAQQQEAAEKPDYASEDRRDHQTKQGIAQAGYARSEEHTSELQSLMRISYAVFCLK